MITAHEARANRRIFEIEQYETVKKFANDILDAIGKSIEFHSKKGLSSAEFMPYTKTRFPEPYARKLASEMFEEVLKEHGFGIVKNDWEHNSLKVVW